MRGFWGGSEAAVVQGGWGVSAVGWEGPVSPRVGRVGLVRIWAILLGPRPLQRKKLHFCFCERCPETAWHHAEVVRVTLHMRPV